MVVSLKPELEQLVAEKVKAGLFTSAEALVNSAVAQVVEGDDLKPGEMEALLAVGERQAREGKVVDGDAAFARLKAKKATPGEVRAGHERLRPHRTGRARPQRDLGLHRERKHRASDAVVADIRAALELLAVPFIPNPSPPRAAGCGAENNGLVSFVPWWFNRID